MKIIIILFLTTYTYANSDSSFEDWEIKFEKKFDSIQERNYRKKIFEANQAEIKAHNANPENSWKKALNAFSHLEPQEFVNKYCRTTLPKNVDSLSENQNDFRRSPRTYPFGSYTASNAPASVDYSYLMQPVQDQGGCGSCWAFVTMGQLEGMLKIRNSSYNTVLSPQYLVNCDTSDFGCYGGWPTSGFYWLKSSTGGNNSAPSMSVYPYTATDGNCTAPSSKIALGINTITQNYFAGNETALKVQIVNYGPTAVAIDASTQFQSYSSGVLHDTLCYSGTACDSFNHGLIITGYGTDATHGDYWLAKNSWGTGWGEAGYIRLARNSGNDCSVACYAMFSR